MSDERPDDHPTRSRTVRWSLIVFVLLLGIDAVFLRPWRAQAFFVWDAVTSVTEWPARRALRKDLERLMNAQDRHYEEELGFTSNPGDLSYEPGDGITVSMVASGQAWWRAVGNHEALGPDQKCGVWDAVIRGHHGPMISEDVIVVRPRKVQCTWDLESYEQMHY